MQFPFAMSSTSTSSVDLGCSPLTTHAMVSSAFPPCTAVECTVDDEEKRRASSGNSKEPYAMTEKCVSACAAYGRVCPCAARIASHEACEAMTDLQKDSKIFSLDERQFDHIDSEAITIFEKIGEGGFSNVNRCQVKDSDGGSQEYAVKYLKRKVMVDLYQFKHGAADLATEAFFLHTLDHPNIVRLHGVSAGSIENNVASGRECGFFIVVDRLHETLEKRIERYRKEQEKTSALARRGNAYREKSKKDLMERVRIALSIAKALEYLHGMVSASQSIGRKLIWLIIHDFSFVGFDLPRLKTGQYWLR